MLGIHGQHISQYQPARAQGAATDEMVLGTMAGGRLHWSLAPQILLKRNKIFTPLISGLAVLSSGSIPSRFQAEHGWMKPVCPSLSERPDSPASPLLRISRGWGASVTSGRWACQVRSDGWLWWLVLLKVPLGKYHLPAGGLQRRRGSPGEDPLPVV